MDYQKRMEEEAKWAEIDLDALSYNMKQIRHKVGKNVKIAAVVKANAYGHGAEELIQTLVDSGADQFAVSSLDEAMELRRCGVNREIPFGAYFLRIGGNFSGGRDPAHRHIRREGRASLGSGGKDRKRSSGSHCRRYRHDEDRLFSGRRGNRGGGKGCISAGRKDRRAFHSLCDSG